MTDRTPTASASPPETPETPDLPPARLSAGGVRFRGWLHAVAALLVIGTFALIAIGGNVTSLDAGMDVPDWPGTFGYNMFLAPLDVWFHKVGAFWEHSHRLTGAAVGLITIGLAIGLWVTQRRRPWLRWLGLSLLGLVIIQGLMGGFRVAENSVLLAGVHGVLGQLVLCAALIAAAATGRFWITAAAMNGYRPSEPQPAFRWEVAALFGLLLAALVGSIALSRSGYTETHREWSWVRVGGIWAVAMTLYMAIALGRLAWALRKARRPAGPGTACACAGPGRAAMALLLLLVVQLVVGAAVRHSGAEKAIPDAPLVFGSLLPPNTPEQLDAAVATLPPAIDPPPPDTTVGMVHLHYTHRVLAVAVIAVLAWVVVSLIRHRRLDPAVVPPLVTVLGLVICQILLGLMTVWTGIYPSVATMHQATGAALLAFVTWLVIRIHLTAPPPAAAVRPATPAPPAARGGAANAYNPQHPPLRSDPA